jgi:K+-sensing histidine kinase KdpD
MLIKNSRAWVSATSQGYLFAIIAVLIAFYIRLELQPFLQSSFPVLFFIISTTLVSYKFGSGPALLSIVLSLPLAYYFFIPPFNSFEIEIFDFIGLTIYAFLFFLIVFLIEKLQRERYRAILIARVCESRMLIMAKLSLKNRRKF